MTLAYSVHVCFDLEEPSPGARPRASPMAGGSLMRMRETLQYLCFVYLVNLLLMEASGRLKQRGEANSRVRIAMWVW